MEKSPNIAPSIELSSGVVHEKDHRKSHRLEVLRKHFDVEVSTNHADLLLLACCLISGFVDSTLYNAYNTFVSMQTGNTIFVGLGASGQNLRPYGWARSLMSIVCFVLGSFFFSRLSRFFGPQRRRTLVLSFLLQSACILVAAGTIQSGAIAGEVPPVVKDIVWNQIAPISLLSFQSAGQIVGSRGLNLSEIPTVVVTSLLCDLWSDPDIAKPRNVKRNRRAVAFTLTLIGAIVGGWMSKATSSVTAALWLAGGVKVMIVLAWSAWAKKVEKAEGATAV